jgi:hypothetical protein
MKNINWLFATTSLLVMFIFSAVTNNLECQQKYYRSAIVIADSLRLDNNEVLKKGTIVQIVSNKNTEEGFFIRTKKDSALVYYKDITPICWLKSNVTININNKSIELKNDSWYLFDSVENSYCYIVRNGNKYKVKISDIFFDKKRFYDDLIK